MLLTPRAGFGEDHEAFREAVAKFVAPRVNARPRDVFAAAGEAGFLGTAVPESLGGGGVEDPRFTAVLAEETAGAGAPGLALVLARHSGVCIPAVACLPDGSDRDELLRAMADGTVIAAPAVLTAEFTAGAVPGAAVADLFVCVAGHDLLVVPRNAVRVTPVDRPLGGEDAAAADIQLSPDPAVRHPGVSAVLRDLDVWAAVVALAGAASAYAMTLDYVRSRNAFGRPIIEFENTRHRLAEIAAALDIAQHYLDGALTASAESALTAARAAAARMNALQVFDLAADWGMQLHGGYGYMREYPISSLFAAARFLRLAADAASDPRGSLTAALGV